MVFKLPNTPSPEAEPHELADFAELLCLIHGRTSARELVAYLGRIDENDSNAGCEDDEDENAAALDEVMNEIERRATACDGGYPFKLDMEGTVLRLNREMDQQDPVRSVIYQYLLLCTRLNMKESRRFGDLDGVDILEELSAHVLKNYLGPARAKSKIFGTSIGGNFKDRVSELCHGLKEGGGYRCLDGADVTNRAKDDKLDTLAWIPFKDELPGQLIVFSQCKTGTTWQDQVTQTRPKEFNKKWMAEPFIVEPVRAYCIAEAPDRSRWKSTSVSTGILFDRCRLVDFSAGLAPDVAAKIIQWTHDAKQAITNMISL